jgi:hypothetical protein
MLSLFLYASVYELSGHPREKYDRCVMPKKIELQNNNGN